MGRPNPTIAVFIKQNQLGKFKFAGKTELLHHDSQPAFKRTIVCPTATNTSLLRAVVYDLDDGSKKILKKNILGQATVPTSELRSGKRCELSVFKKGRLVGADQGHEEELQQGLYASVMEHAKVVLSLKEHAEEGAMEGAGGEAGGEAKLRLGSPRKK